MSTDHLILILLVLLVLVVIALLALVLIVVLKSGILNKKDEDEKPESRFGASIVEAYTCVNHPEQNAIATCAICEDAICENCHKDWEGLHLCPEHFGLYGKHTWIEIAEIRTTPSAPEKGHKLYHFKHKLWNDEKVPAYLVTHYKIDVDGDHIESWVKLYAREEDADQLTTRFSVISNR